jgi:hypothetical protein
MFETYCDGGHDTIINYTASIGKELFGLDKINRIFMDIKNSVYYDCFAPMQCASETLVMGRGNNLDKAILLSTVLKESGFENKINFTYVKDVTNRLFSRSNKPIPWFYVEVEFFGRKMIYDCSFDQSFMRAAGIKHIGQGKDYNFKDYVIDGTRLFIPIEGQVNDIDEKIKSILRDVKDFNFFSLTNGISIA